MAAQPPVGGPEFQVNAYTFYRQYRPDVAIADSGAFVVVWASEKQDGGLDGVFGRRYSAAGVAQGGDFQVNVSTLGIQYQPAVAVDANGDFVVAWRSGPDNSTGEIFAPAVELRGRAGGCRVPGQHVHHQLSASPVDRHGCRRRFRDRLAQQQLRRHRTLGRLRRRFNSSGTPLGGELHVNSYTPSFQEDTAVVMEEDGDFVVVWDSDTGDGDAYGIFGKRFDSAGTALSGDFQINAHTAGYQDRPAVTRSADGVFVVVWQSGGAQDSYGYGIFAKRFGAVPVGAELDVDGNGDVDALTDGLLVLRWAFTFTGTTLVNGATGPGCTRCTGDAVKTYLDPLATTLDIDGNGSTGALTDGLLVLRFLFGFTGTTLTNDAVGPNCTRCTAPPIESYLGTLVV